MIIRTLEERTKTFLDRMAEMHPDIEVLGTYVNNHAKIECRCKVDGNIWKAVPYSLLSGSGCPSCRGSKISASKTKTQEQFVQSIQKRNPDIEVIGKYTGLYNFVRCKCKDCGYEFDVQATCLVWQRRRCPLCTNKVVVQGINDVATTHPSLTKYFKNQDDAHKYCATNAVQVAFKCPTCGDERSYQLNVISRKGYHCSFCGDRVSFPNRVIRGLLKYLKAENFEYEYAPNWAGKYLYDATFTKDGQRYVVEMDGGFHYKVAHFKGYTEEDLLERQEADRVKDKLAKQNNCIMIRVNSYPEKMEHIVSQIQSSLLSELFNLSNVPWDDILYYDKELLSQICSMYANDNMSATKIAKQIGIERHSIAKYLHRGTQLGLCNYSVEDAKGRCTRIPIKCTDTKTNEIHIYNSITDVLSLLVSKGISTSYQTIRQHSKTCDNYKGYILERI